MTSKVFKVKCDRLDDFGRGIVYIDNNTVFVKDMLPNEICDVKTTYSYGKIKDAIVLKRYNCSINRVKPICKYFKSCGGCNLQHLSYLSQIEYKTSKVKNLLHKFLSKDIDVLPCLKVLDPKRFRNKVIKPLKKSGDSLSIGFYKENTHDLINIEDCLMESVLSSRITKLLKQLIKKYDYSIYDEETNSGDIKNILIKTNKDETQALVTLVINCDQLKKIDNFCKELVSNIPQVKTVVLNINKRKTNVVLSKLDRVVYGKGFIIDSIFDKKFMVSSCSFYQTNSKMIETLYGSFINQVCFNKSDVVLDAYCGNGTIGLSLASKVKQVIGVDIENQSILNAAKNQKLNNINNACFYLEDCTNFINNSQFKFDIVILDPPRKGTTINFIDAINKIRPRIVIYISCNPVTLARDLNYFLKFYKIDSVQPIDMFPNTTHVETVVILSRNSKIDKMEVELNNEKKDNTSIKNED